MELDRQLGKFLLNRERPAVVQYLIWLGKLVRGDWGASILTGRPVLQDVLVRLPVTLELIVLSMAVALLIAVPAGIIGALRRNTWADYAATSAAMVGVSIPEFFVGVLLLLAFSIGLQGLLPSSGWIYLPGTCPNMVCGVSFWGNLQHVLFAEAAASFEELTLSNRDDELKMQVPDAWPNFFRMSRFLSAVDFVQADRLRRRVAGEMARVMDQVDLLLVPSLRDEMLTISNFTGHPSLTLRTGFLQVTQARSDWAPDPAHPLPTFSPPRRVPHGVTLIGRLFDEGTIGRVGVALERAAGVAQEKPPAF